MSYDIDVDKLTDAEVREYLAALELLERERLEKSHLEFTKHFFEKRHGEFIVGKHHVMIAEALEKVERGEIKNLVINVPPRYGKTSLAVINWVARCLAINPRAKFIHLSYSDELALDNSSQAKELVESDEYQEYWQRTLKADSKSKKKWYTEEGGGLYATSAGGAITGFGAGLTKPSGKFDGSIIIDDGHKVDDIESKLVRERTNNRLNTTIKSRRNHRDTPIVIIMQRLDCHDMSGFVLNGGMGEDFYHLNIPAINEDGTALWEYKNTIEELRTQEKADKKTFSAQMMQEPSIDGGNIIRKEWWRKWELSKAPSCIEIIQSYDTAFTVKDSSDFTARTTWGMFKYKQGNVERKGVILLEAFKDKLSYPDLREEVVSSAKIYDPDIILIEDKGSGISLGQELRKTTDLPIHMIQVKQDKETRAHLCSGLLEGGAIWYMPRKWAEEVIDSCAAFPNAEHDDDVDTCTQLWNFLRKRGGLETTYEDIPLVDGRKGKPKKFY